MADLSPFSLQVIAVDIPIGLPAQGDRQCDREARRLLRERASSVFPAPIRPLLDARSYSEACAIRSSIEAKKISLQTYFLLGKIAEVDRLLRNDPFLREKVYEVHPEMCFRALNGGFPIPFSKKTRAGRARRLELLEAHFGSWVTKMLAEPRELHCAGDDILDAFAALWTAERISDGTSQTIPDPYPLDVYGLPMRMLF